MQHLRAKLLFLGLAAFVGSCHSKPPPPGETTSVRFDHRPSAEEIAALLEQDSLRELMIWLDGESFAPAGGPGKRFDDADLARVAALPQLERLIVGGWDMAYTDEGLEVLTSLENLQHLSLCQAPGITDVGMKRVAQLPNLRSLDITYTAVTEVGLEHLLDAPALEEVAFGWTQRTAERLQLFRQRHPEVRWFDSTKL